MRSAFAHEAVVEMRGHGDPGALGAAITVAVCGHWEHEPPCPLAPHHTRTRRRGDAVLVRTLIVTELDREGEVRDRITGALAAGRLTDPQGQEQRWALRSERPAAVQGDEREHARRLGAD